MRKLFDGGASRPASARDSERCEWMPEQHVIGRPNPTPPRPAYVKLKRSIFLLAGTFLAAAEASAQAPAQEPPSLGSVWFEKILGSPEQMKSETGRELHSITGNKKLYRFEDGIYTSTLARISLKLPRVGTENEVTVREGIPYFRANGDVATAHLVILPGSMAMAPVADNQAISAVVVTRLRDDRPKDRESVLRQWEPSSQSERDRMHENGIDYTRVTLPRWGETVQVIIFNRASIEPFPYRKNVLRSAARETVGVSRYVVMGRDSLIEFSQIVPCGQLAAENCRTEALASVDRLMDGVVKFLTLPVEKNKE